MSIKVRFSGQFNLNFRISKQIINTIGIVAPLKKYFPAQHDKKNLSQQIFQKIKRTKFSPAWEFFMISFPNLFAQEEQAQGVRQEQGTIKGDKERDCYEIILWFIWLLKRQCVFQFMLCASLPSFLSLLFIRVIQTTMTFCISSVRGPGVLWIEIKVFHIKFWNAFAWLL